MSTNKPTRGRPRTRPPESQEAVIYIRTHKDRKAAYNAQARASGKTLVGWMLETCDPASGYKPAKSDR